jgi:hypothetical protein
MSSRACCIEYETADSYLSVRTSLHLHVLAKYCYSFCNPLDDPAAGVLPPKLPVSDRSQNAQAACCTSGQPTYKGMEVNFVGLPTCSDGPCSGQGFDYRGAGASQSPNPDSCCDTETDSAFMYNPPATLEGATWPPIEQFPDKWPGTGRKCNPEAPRYRCTLGGQVGAAAAAAIHSWLMKALMMHPCGSATQPQLCTACPCFDSLLHCCSASACAVLQLLLLFHH